MSVAVWVMVMGLGVVCVRVPQVDMVVVDVMVAVVVVGVPRSRLVWQRRTGGLAVGPKPGRDTGQVRVRVDRRCLCEGCRWRV